MNKGARIPSFVVTLGFGLTVKIPLVFAKAFAHTLPYTLFILCLLAPLHSFADNDIQFIKDQEFKNPGLHIGFLEESEDRTIFSYSADELFIPASVQKLYTTKAVLNNLGPEYVFETDFYFDASSNSLFILPSADPSLTSESLLSVVRSLAAYGIDKISRIFVIQNSGDTRIERGGARAYEAGAYPLSFNYNAVGFALCPSAVGKQAIVIPQSSLNPDHMVNKTKTGKARTEGKIEVQETSKGWEVQGQIAEDAECLMRFQSSGAPEQYLLEELQKISKAFGLTFSAKQIERVSTLSPQAFKVYTIRSAPVKDLLATMNRQSSNFYANQFVLALGKQATNFFSFEAGLVRISSSLKESLAKIGDKNASNPPRIVDGSGLSRLNSTSPRQLLETFKNLYSDVTYRSVLENSLPVYGQSGTLRLRSAELLPCVIRAKTGTLDGVSSMVGVLYQNGQAENAILFALVQNGTKSLDQGRAFEDKLLSRLCNMDRK